MTTERSPFPHPSSDERPSQRVVPLPPPGSDEAAFLANLNDVYGEADSGDEIIQDGIRIAMRDVLERE